ncbi:MAG: PAS domain S-box protein [Kiritimatiellia bacterium]
MTTPPTLPAHRLRLGVLLLAVFALGAALANWAYRREDRRLRDELLEQTRRMAETIPLDRLRVLHGNRTDEQKPEYRRLKEQLMAAQQVDPDWEWIYLMGRRKNDVVYFQMDSEAYDAPDPSPPGQFYPEASPLLHEVFDKRIATTEGPVADRWGTWVSAFVPLVDPKTDRLVTVVGIDVEASTWRGKALRATRVPLLATAALLLLLATGSRLLGQRKTHSERFRRCCWRHLEAMLAAAIGLVLTLTATWIARRIETTHAREAFGALAQIRTERILDAFLSLRRSELEGLARFIDGSEEVTSREFQRYARHLIRVPEVVAWAWVPVVEGAQRAAFEQAVRDAGWQAPEYRLWDADAAGQPVPAAERPRHYPIYHVESGEALSKYGITPGRDLAAIPAIRETIEAAVQNDLITATAVLPPLPGATSQRNQFLVFRPVRKILPRGQPVGFAMASVDPQSFLRSFLGENPEENMQVALDLLSLRPGEAPRRIAAIAPPEFSANPPPRLTGDWTISRPILAFGRAYAVAVRPTAQFLAYHSFHLGWLVLLAGVSITAASALILGFTVHRREDLMQLAEQQARKLAESAHRFGLLAQQNRIAIWQIDAAGRYTEVGDVFEALSGYAAEELVGKKHFFDLTPEEFREKLQAETLAAIRRGEPLRDLVHPVQTRAGAILWALTSGVPLRDERGAVTGYWGTSIDVTERRRGEERLAELARENQLAAHRYAALIRASNTGAWEYDHATQRIWCSPEYFSMLGYDPAAFALPPEHRTLAACWLDLIHPSDREGAHRQLATSLRQPDRPFDLRFRMRRRDGNWAWIWSRGQMVSDAAGRPTGLLVGTHIDVTESMRAEEALRENERKYRMLAENMKDVVWIADVETNRYLYVSPSVEALRGLAADAVLAQPLDASIAPAMRAAVMERLRAAAADCRAGRRAAEAFFTQEIPHGRPDGSVVETEAICRFWPNERTGRLELHGSTRDVSERKRVEDALRKSQKQMIEAQAMAHIGSWDHDLRTGRIDWTDEAYRIFGAEPQSAPASPELFFERVHPDDRAAVADAYAAALRNRTLFQATYRLLLPDGTIRHVRAQGETTFAADGTPVRTIGTMQDVTAARRAEDALRDSERKYRMLTESMKDVVWIVDADTLRFLYVSPSVEPLRGYPVEEIMAGTIADCLLPDQVAPLQRLIRQRAEEFRRGEINDRTFFTLELKQPRKNGEPIVTEAVVRFWRDAATGRLELHGVTRDVTERKRAEEDYRTLFQNMLEGFALHEIVADEHGEARDYRFLAVNPAFERMTGLKAADILGQTARAVLPDLDAHWVETYGNVVRTGLPAFFEDYSTPLGRSFEVTAFRSAPGQFACIFSDVTERKLALDELRESRRRYVSLLANLPGMAYRCRNDREWTMEFVSQGCLDLTGYAPEDLVANRKAAYNDLIRPAYRESVWTAWQEVLRTHGRFEMEYEIAARDGETKWVWEQGEGVYDARGGVVALEGFIADVTARKRAEGERERLIRAIEQSGETILITDAAGTILYVNPAFTRVTGFTREEVLGQTPHVLQSGVHDREFYRAMWATLQAGQTWEGQLVNRRKDGTLYTEQAAISPVRDAAGRIVNFVAVKRDVTRELQAEEENTALQAQLAHAQKLESLGRLAGGVAHDFNNMLQAILGYVEIAIEQVPADQPLHADLREIQKAAARSTTLTRQLQAFARKQVAAPRVLDLNEAVAGMFGMLRRLIGEDVQLIWKPGRNVGHVKIDPSQLDQAVANLCINARDAIGPAGHITLATGAEDVPATAAGAVAGDLKPGSYAVLTVHDDGVGMNPDVVAHIFEPFFTTKPVGKGTGLGLSTVYGTAKQNGGDVRVESRPGHGSTFKIYLPRETQPDDGAPEAVSPPADPVARPHETILLVEDEEVILRTTKRILESLGYRVLATHSPQDALRIAAEAGQRLDLLITDVIMGGMNGPDLVRHLHETRPDLRYLFMSGYTAHLLAEQGVQDGSAHFIQKPFNRNALATKVREVLAAT